MFADNLAHCACKLVVDGVAGACCNDASLQRLSYEGKVAYDIKQLVSCRLVVPNERLVVQITELLRIHVRNSEYIGKLVIFVLRHLTLIYHNSIVKVASLD